MKQSIVITLLSILWFITGCTSSKQHINIISTVNTTTTLVYSESLYQYAPIWSKEAHRKYPNSIVILSHGNDIDGLWWCEYPDYDGKRLVSELVDQIRFQYPLRRIVLVICNPGGYVLTTPNISYSLTNIWVVPDRELDIRSWIYPDTIGNIYEMQEN